MKLCTVNLKADNRDSIENYLKQIQYLKATISGLSKIV
jgi:hypothetical protein